MRRSAFLRLSLLALAATLIPACLRSSRTPTTSLGVSDGEPALLQPITGATTIRSATVTGSQEVPPVASSGTGSASVEVDAAQTRLVTTLAVNGLADVTGADIQVGNVGANGPVVFTLTNDDFTSPHTVVLTEEDLIPAPSLGIRTFADAVDALTTGRLYVNVQTAAHPGGELRGQLGPVILTSGLTGGQVVPSVATPASGLMTFTLNPTQTAIVFTGSTSGVPTMTSTTLQSGAAGTTGPTLFTLSNGSSTGTMSGTLTSANFQPQPAAGITTFDQAVNAMLSGTTFVSVQSAANPNGEIRGQVTPR